MRFLLDTNVFIAAMTLRNQIVQQRMIDMQSRIDLSAIVMHRLLFGAYKSDRIAENLERIAALGIPVLDFNAEDARAAGEIRATLKRRGTPIGPYDVLIAGQAMARGLTLVTANTSEFSRVEGLSLADWTA